MDDITTVRGAVDRMLLGDFEPLLDLLNEDVVFQVAAGGEAPVCLDDFGTEPVLDYFRVIGGLVSFWQIDYTARGDQLIAWGRESFTVEPCGVEATSEFALVFELAEGLITRLLVIEDLPSFFQQRQDWATFSTPSVFDLVEHLATSALA